LQSFVDVHIEGGGGGEIADGLRRQLGEPGGDPVIQSILRHANPSTMANYIHRVNAAHLTAQGKFLDAINMTTAAE
jgi:integrase